MSNEYEDLLAEIDSLRAQVRNVAARSRVGNPVYGGPINADVTQSAKTSGPFMWLVDSTHSLEVVLPVQSYVHRVLDAMLRVTLRPVRAASATTGSPNITTTDDNSQASSSSTTNDNAASSSSSTSGDSSPASSSTTTDDNAASSSTSSSNDNAQSSSVSTTDATGSTINVESAGHVHLWATLLSTTASHGDPLLAAALDQYRTYDSSGGANNSFDIFPVTGSALYTAISAASPTAVPTAAHQHGMAHTHNHHHDITHTHNHHHDFTHTHTHNHGMTHTHNHSHDMTHTHNHHHTLDHTHPMTIASSITEGGSPAGVRLYLDTGAGYTELTSALGGPWDANFEVQLARYFNDTLQPRQPIIGNHKLLLTSTSVGTLEVNLDWYQMLKPVTSA